MNRTTTDLEAFIRLKAGGTAQGEPEVDWQARKGDWLKSIVDLYAVIRKWLAPLEKDGVVRFLTANITIQEEQIGSYGVEVLTILIGKQKVALEDAWEHYQVSRDSIVQAAEHTKRTILSGSAPDQRFFAMSSDEVDEFFAVRLDEADRQACLFLVASAEAALRVDFLQRVYDRRKDAVSRAFRDIYKNACGHSRLKVRLDEDILDTWATKVPQAKARVGDLRGALNYRHWLAHGRYWVPKLGRQYDPTGLLTIISGLFGDIGLAR